MLAEKNFAVQFFTLSDLLTGTSEIKMFQPSIVATSSGVQ